MKTLVVYHSQFGNTKTLAEVIGKTLEALGPSAVLSIEDPGATRLDGIELLVVGGPTQAHSTSPAVRSFLQGLKDRKPVGLYGAAFDTRLKGPELLWGSAAKGTANALKQAGLQVVVAPESFIVKGTKDPQLEEGEVDRARRWAAELGERVAQLQPVPRR